MPRSTNQKMKLLCLCRILWERTDEDHPMTVPELIRALEEWDIKEIGRASCRERV